LSDRTEHARVNERSWTKTAPSYVAPAERAWASREPSWGIWGVGESDVRALEGIQLEGADAVELGCGTAYWSAWLARLGARPVGVDVTEAQLATARRLQAEHGLTFPLIHGSILVLCLPDAEDEAAGPTLLREYFGMHRFDWPDDDPPCVEFHLGYGDWIRVLRTNGFEVENLIEVRPPEGATSRYPFVTSEWARRWPAEEIWIARKC